MEFEITEKGRMRDNLEKETDEESTVGVEKQLHLAHRTINKNEQTQANAASKAAQKPKPNHRYRLYINIIACLFHVTTDAVLLAVLW